MNRNNVKRAFDRYLIAVEKGLRGTLPSGANMESTRAQKPGSRSPQNAFGERFISNPENARARMMFEPALRYLADEEPRLFAALRDEAASPGLRGRMETVNGEKKHPYLKPTIRHVDKTAPESVKRRAEFDHAEEIRAHEHRKKMWKADKERAPGWLALFDEARSEVAAFVARWFAHEPEPTVDLDPDDEPSKSPTQAAAKARERAKGPQRAETRQQRVDLLRAIREREGCGVREAMDLWAKETGMSWWTIKRCLEGEPEGSELSGAA